MPEVERCAVRGAEVVAIAADLVRAGEADALAAKVRERFGPAHILGHFAGARGAVDWFLENERPGIAVGRRGRPEEVASAAALMLSERASHANGCNWRVDGGAVLTAFGRSAD